MSGLTPGFRAELRTRTEDSDYVITVKRSVMLALLDAADELDRLVAPACEAERSARVADLGRMGEVDE